MSEWMPDRMRERMSAYMHIYICQKVCRNKCQKECQNIFPVYTYTSRCHVRNYVRIINQISLFPARGCPSLVMWCQPSRNQFDGEGGLLEVKLVMSCFHLIHLAIWLYSTRLSNKSRRLHRFGGSHFTEVSPLQQDWWVFFHTFYMSMCAQLESYRGQKELYTELSIVSAKVGNQFFSNARVPLLLANVEIWCKKTTCSETGRVFCFDRFCSADIFSWGTTCTNKTHVPFYNNNIYIQYIYIFFFPSLSLSNVFFSRRRRLEFALVRVPIGPLTNRHFRAPSNRELDFGTFRQSKLAMGNFAAGFESILITRETWRLFRALVRVGR